jgi:hypothetical protein
VQQQRAIVEIIEIVARICHTHAERGVDIAGQPAHGLVEWRRRKTAGLRIAGSADGLRLHLGKASNAHADDKRQRAAAAVRNHKEGSMCGQVKGVIGAEYLCRSLHANMDRLLPPAALLAHDLLKARVSLKTTRHITACDPHQPCQCEEQYRKLFTHVSNPLFALA